MESWNEKRQCWVNEHGGRVCTTDNETLIIIAENCKEFIQKRNRIYLDDVKTLLGKALEGVRDKSDLCDGEKETIKKIRQMIKGL